MVMKGAKWEYTNIVDKAFNIMKVCKQVVHNRLKEIRAVGDAHG